MSPRAECDRARRVAKNPIMFLGLLLLVCSPAHRAGTAASPVRTRLSGCLRQVSEREFILVADNRLGYSLKGKRKVFSRHVDQEVEITGNALPGTPPSPSVMLGQTSASSDRKKGNDEIRIAGLPMIQVSSLTPRLQKCTMLPAER